MDTIWVVKDDRRIDHSIVEKIGRINPVFTATSPHDVGEQRRVIDNDVIPHANEKDKILLVGPILMNFSLLTAWIKKFGYATVLLYDQKNNRYVERRVSAPR